MNLSARAGAVLRHLALSAGVGIAVLFIALAGLGFVIFAYFTWLLTHFPSEEAGAITGATLILIAAATGMIGFRIVKKLKKPQPSVLADFGGTLGVGLRLASLLVRKDPKKAIILATVAGAVAEYLLNDTRE
jgi:uncharacterized membrane protein (UPF0136 family)